MIVEIIYQGDTSTLRFTEWKSMEGYLLKWGSKPAQVTIRFERLTEQVNYYSEVYAFVRSLIKAQKSKLTTEWVISVYGFDQQKHTIDLAA